MVNTVTTAISGQGQEQMLPDGCHNTSFFIDDGAKVCTTQVDRATSTTLTDITGLSVNVLDGATYMFEAYITGVATANGGAKLAIGGTATATSCSYNGKNYNSGTLNANTTTTTLGNAVGAATAAMTDAVIKGSIVVNQGGTLTVQIAQNTSHADTTSAYVNSNFKVTRIA